MALGGCGSSLTYAEINKAWHRSGCGQLFSSQWFYQGSDDRHHFFARYKGLLSLKTRSYRVNKVEVDVRGEFPLTQIRSEWKIVEVRLMSVRFPGDDDFPQTLDFAKR